MAIYEKNVILFITEAYTEELKTVEYIESKDNMKNQQTYPNFIGPETVGSYQTLKSASEPARDYGGLDTTLTSINEPVPDYEGRNESTNQMETSSNGEEPETATYSKLNGNTKPNKEHPYTKLDQQEEFISGQEKINHNWNLHQKNSYNVISKLDLVVIKIAMSTIASLALAVIAVAIYMFMNKHGVDLKLTNMETRLNNIRAEVGALQKGINRNPSITHL